MSLHNKMAALCLNLSRVAKASLDALDKILAFEYEFISNIVIAVILQILLNYIAIFNNESLFRSNDFNKTLMAYFVILIKLIYQYG